MPSLKGFLRKMRDAVGFNAPNLDLPPERENEIIEKLANYATKYGMELPSLMLAWYTEPISTILVQTTLLPFTPILEFLGIKAYDYMAFFSKKENVRRLIDRINELEGKYQPRV